MLISSIIDLLQGLPAEFAVMVISMLPIAELRVAIPLGIGAYDMSPFTAYAWAVLGNCIPPIAIVLFLEKIADLLSSRYPFWNRFFVWLFNRTQLKAKNAIEKYGPLGLFLLVAIPLPFTGAWTGAMAAFLFGIRHRESIPMIVLGILAAGCIMLFLTLGAKGIFMV
jgi:uncharacterized membrane protein